MARLDRPLSPHVGIYRWQITNTLSILHRATGLALTVGALVFTAWLVAVAAGPDSYQGATAWLRSPVGVLLLLAWTFCFFYHLCNGIRHLAWDAGYGFEMRQARASGLAVVASAVVLTLVFWLAVLAAGRGP